MHSFEFRWVIYEPKLSEPSQYLSSYHWLVLCSTANCYHFEEIINFVWFPHIHWSYFWANAQHLLLVLSPDWAFYICSIKLLVYLWWFFFVLLVITRITLVLSIEVCCWRESLNHIAFDVWRKSIACFTKVVLSTNKQTNSSLHRHTSSALITVAAVYLIRGKQRTREY